jgi:hypothetical protein
VGDFERYFGRDFGRVYERDPGESFADEGRRGRRADDSDWYRTSSEGEPPHDSGWNEDAEGYGDRSWRRSQGGRGGSRAGRFAGNENSREDLYEGGRTSGPGYGLPVGQVYGHPIRESRGGSGGQGFNHMFGREESFRDYRGRGPKGYQRADERIHEEACELLTDHPQVDASDLEIKVEHGVVTLTGTICDRRSKRLAAETVENVRGVKDVNNHLRVQPASERHESSRQPQSLQ